MDGHKCTQMERIRILEEAINGNGSLGLKQKVAKFEVLIDQVTEAINNNATVQSALLKFMNEEKGKDKEKKNNRWLITILVTLSLGILGLVIGLLTK